MGQHPSSSCIPEYGGSCEIRITPVDLDGDVNPEIRTTGTIRFNYFDCAVYTTDICCPAWEDINGNPYTGTYIFTEQILKVMHCEIQFQAL